MNYHTFSQHKNNLGILGSITRGCDYREVGFQELLPVLGMGLAWVVQGCVASESTSCQVGVCVCFISYFLYIVLDVEKKKQNEPLFHVEMMRHLVLG